MAGDDLDAVEPRPLHAPRAVAEAGDHLGDQFPAHRRRHDVEALVGNRRWGIADGRRAVERIDDLASGMEELPEDGGALRVDRLGEAPVARDAIVGIGRDGMAHEHPALVHQGHLDDDQPGAPGGTRPVVGDHGLADPALAGHRRFVAGGNDAVLDGQPANGDRRKQIGKLLGLHRPSSLLASAAAAHRSAKSTRR